MRQLIQDLQYALRMLAKNPAFTLAVVLMLALGIGVNASVFSFIDFMLLQPLPVPEANRIVVVSRGDTTLFSHPDYSDYRNRTRAFTALAASTPTEASFDLEGQSEAITAEAVSASYQDVMRVPLVRGQWFTDEDQPVAVISYGAWQRRFHGDSKVLGKQVRCLAHWYTVVGVAPPDYTGIFAPMKTDLWVPRRYWVSQTPRLAAQAKDRSAHEVMIFGRLQPGVTATRAAANLNAVDLQIRNDNRAAAKPNTPLTVSTVHGAADSGNRKESIPVAVLLMAVVALVLMVACVNIGNLLLARGAARQRELAIRVAMGASRLCILRQLMTENAVLALAGAAGGLVLGAWTNRLLESLTPSLVIGTSFELRTSSRAIIFVLAVTFLATLLFGLLPAWHSTRTDVFPMLKGESGLRRRFRLVLLLSAGLLLRSTLRLQGTDPGFAVNNRLYAFTYVSPPEFTPETGLKFYAKTLDDLRALPGVRNVALTHFLPFLDEGSDCVSDGRLTPFEATLGTIDSGYFTTMKIPLLAGRDFSPLDISGSPPVVIVNQSLADRLWPGRRAVGQHLRIGCRQPSTAEVVGIARDSKTRSPVGAGSSAFLSPVFPKLYWPSHSRCGDDFQSNCHGRDSTQDAAAGEQKRTDLSN